MRHVIALMSIYGAGIWTGATLLDSPYRWIAHGLIVVVAAVYALWIERRSR